MCGRKNKKAKSCCKQENNGKHKTSFYQCMKKQVLGCLRGLEPLCITILLISVNKMLMKFQGQWMSVDISSSFFPKVVCTGEVKTCSISSCHGRQKGTCLLCSSFMHSPCMPPLLTPQPGASSHSSAQVLCKGDVSAAVQEQKECRQLGTPSTAVPKAPPLALVGSAQHPLSFLC